MKKKNKVSKMPVLGLTTVITVISFAALFAVSTTACFGQSGGGISFNSAGELKAYLDKQPANRPDKPINIAVKANDEVFRNIVEVIWNAGKYVILDLSGSGPLPTIAEDGGYEAFSNAYLNEGCPTLVGIIIPNSVTSIGSSAFEGCANLASVTIPNSVKRIGDSAFADCTSLTSITIPNGVTAIGNGAFVRCSGLTSITIPNSVTTIGEMAFSDCARLVSVTIPNGVKNIEMGAFQSCASLTSITIPNSVTSIAGYAFNSCTSLTNVTFQGAIASNFFNEEAFGNPQYGRYYIGDLRNKFYATDKAKGTPGTYTRPNGSSKTWTKQ